MISIAPHCGNTNGMELPKGEAGDGFEQLVPVMRRLALEAGRDHGGL
jgi:hypothetical protein